MNIMGKLNTLFRASAREAVEQVVDANGVRVYEQEIIDAESLLAQRRGVMAEMIANRRELEAEIERTREGIARRELELGRLPETERCDSLLQLAAQEIAAAETHLQQLAREHASLDRGVQELEMSLRGLMREIRQHRRDLRSLRSQSHMARQQGSCAADTLNGRLQALRQTRGRISERISGCQQLEAGVAETAQRLDEDPLQSHLDRAGVSDGAQHVARVLARLKGGASAQ
jgi:phage shock protein A